MALAVGATMEDGGLTGGGTHQVAPLTRPLCGGRDNNDHRHRKEEMVDGAGCAGKGEGLVKEGA